MANPPYDGPWPRVRKAILERDGHLCQIRGPKCKVVANRVDHIVPVTQGGEWYEPSNLRASCDPCNRGRVDQTRNDRWRHGRTRIVLVVGPPASGKSTYVQSHRSSDDLVVEYDDLARALGATGPVEASDPLHRATMAARNALIRDLEQGKCRARRAWITSTNPAAEEFLPHHEVIDLGGPGSRDEVMGRIKSRGGPGRHIIAAEDWYARRGRAETSAETSASRDW